MEGRIESANALTCAVFMEKSLISKSRPGAPARATRGGLAKFTECVRDRICGDCH